MGKTYEQPGEVITYVNGTGNDIAVNSPVVIGVLVGIALVDIPDGGRGAVSIANVHRVPKVAGTAWTAGDPIDYDVSSTAFTTGLSGAAGDVETCGVAIEDAASAATEGLVLLVPGMGVPGSD